MKFFACVCMIVLMCCSMACCTINNTVRAPSKTIDYFYRHAVKLQTTTMAHSVAFTATGFAIDRDRILTAGHYCVATYEAALIGVVSEKLEIVYVNNEKELSVMQGATIDAMHEKMDLCVVRKEAHGILPVILARKNDTRIGDPITVASGPLGMFPAIFSGHVITPFSDGFPIEDLNDRLIINAPVTFGSSGGPIFDAKGEVIGLIKAKMGFDHLMVGVHVETIREFLRLEYGE